MVRQCVRPQGVRLVRVVSLLPSATEIAVAVGLGDQLLGRSHECDFPPWVEQLPVLTATKLRKGLTSREIDDRVGEIVSQGLSVYEVNADLLRALKPDVILTQSQCAVCAVTPRDLEEALSRWVGSEPVLLSLAPDALGDAWDDIQKVADATGRSAEAGPVIARLQERLDALGSRPSRPKIRPRIGCVEWIEPLMAAGNWVPELVEAAGGVPLFAQAGQHSPWLDWSELRAADPDIIILMPCGYKISHSLGEVGPMPNHPEWNMLSAVRSGRIFVADGHHFFNRPGPRLVESAEIIAQIIDAPAGANGSEEQGWVRLR